jgi:DNA-binding IclR family transcriptional regulator
LACKSVKVNFLQSGQSEVIIKERYGSSIEFGTEILALLAHSRESKSSSEIARQLGATPSRASRILSTLHSLGWVKRLSDRTYRLGWRAVQTGQFASTETALVEASMPHVVDLARSTGVRVVVSIPANLRAVVVSSRAESNTAPSVRSGAIFEFPESPTTLLLYANRKRKYAGLDIEVTKLVLSEGSPFASFESFEERLETILSEGMAYSVDVKANGVGSVAVPVHSQTGGLVGALTLIMDSSKFTVANLDRLKILLVSCADSISVDIASREVNWEFRSVP